MFAEITGAFREVEKEVRAYPADWTFKDSLLATIQYEIDMIDSVVAFHNADVFRIVLTDQKNLNFGMGDEEALATAYFMLCHLKARLEILNAALTLVEDEAVRGGYSVKAGFWNQLVTLLLERVHKKIAQANPDVIPTVTPHEIQHQITHLCTLRHTEELQDSWFYERR